MRSCIFTIAFLLLGTLSSYTITAITTHSIDLNYSFIYSVLLYCYYYFITHICLIITLLISCYIHFISSMPKCEQFIFFDSHIITIAFRLLNITNSILVNRVDFIYFIVSIDPMLSNWTFWIISNPFFISIIIVYCVCCFTYLL